MKLLDRFKRSNDVNDRPDFTGKILAVYCSSEERGGIFRDVRLVRIGFSEFLVGRRIVAEPSLQERWSGVVIWTAIHDILQMLVFDDIEAARRIFHDDEAEVKSNLTPTGGDE